MAALFAGCGEESPPDAAPPYDALPLRDALRAAPEVIASLPEETRRDIAQRIEEAEAGDEETTAVAPPDDINVDSVVAAADEARENEGKDALVLGEIQEAELEILLAARAASEKEEAPTATEPPAIRGRPGATTAALEEAALAGRAGKKLRALAERTHTHDMVRTTGLPMGAVAWNDTLYVNASWLVALSTLEKDATLPAPAPGVSMPAQEPLSVEYNPYFLPQTVEECSQQVQTTCTCQKNQSCLQQATDPSFSDANAECAWVNSASGNAEALCVLALMNIDGVRACVESAGSACSALPVASRDDAITFKNNQNCMDVLNACLDGGRPPSTSTGGSQGCSSCNNNCSSCNDDCSKSNDNCSKCNDNCADTNQNCADCNNNVGNCNNNCKSCSVAGSPTAAPASCNLRPKPGRSPLPAPIGQALCLFAPIAYLLVSKRRRS